MMRITIVCFLALFALKGLAQDQRLLCFDLETGTVDTLETPDFDTLKLRDSTPYELGVVDDLYNDLSPLPPMNNTYPGAQYTFKRQASLDFDIHKFPIRTSINLSRMENDTLRSQCSGSMISRRHVLTATHCIAQFGSDSVAYDSLLVCPAFDNGTESPQFDCSWVKKAYLFEGWDISTTDLAILELSAPIGEETGWIGMGYESVDTALLDGLFYKFSYPAIPLLHVDSTDYNGDTLYYGYGVADLASENGFGIVNTNGRSGESGSSLIKVVNEQAYASYGVLTFSNNLYHNRLTNWKYYAFEAIIRDDIQVGVGESEFYSEADVSVFPNPATDMLTITARGNNSLESLVLLDVNGQTMMKRSFVAGNELQLDVRELPVGVYMLHIDLGNKTVTKKIVKSQD